MVSVLESANEKRKIQRQPQRSTSTRGVTGGGGIEGAGLRQLSRSC